MTISDFVWSAGHIGWPLFSIIVFSVLWLIATDVVWRIVRISFRNLLIRAVLAWMIGVAVVVGFYLA